MSSIISMGISKYKSINREVRFFSLFFLWPLVWFFTLVFLKLLEGFHNPILLLSLVIPELMLCMVLASIAVLFLVEWYAQVALRIKNNTLFNITVLIGGGWVIFSITHVSQYFFNLLFKA